MSVELPDYGTIDVGTTGPAITVDAVSSEEFVRYAGASGDFNPLHYDYEYARNAGHDGVFAQGMFTAGILSRAVTEWFGIEAVSTFDVRFVETVHPGDSIRAQAVVADVRTGASSHGIDLELTAEIDDGTTVATGRATVALSGIEEE
ncbi:MaoC family dehydratase [Natrarchaeobius halalkaliphilus]|uniref:MaoC family dehydratase n=1 Tax=Natrarchaeobius halalkaliphilus TaxID=1679091 RepID=UPI001FB1F44C|nr:MaoC/PaaZ C-terminal domain-containing protein [Natrarchaeobius halalkaliphilus]